MVWHDLLFAHWRVDPEQMRRWIPQRLSIDTFDGAAYIGVIPFHMSGIRRRGCVKVPTTHAFAELNVRTYVTDGSGAGKPGYPGVWFFSLDAASRLAVWAARRWYRLNYQLARMRVTLDDEWVRYASVRPRTAPCLHEVHDPDASLRSASGMVEFAGHYRPTGEAFVAEPGTLEDWLTARWCLYAADRRGRVYRGEIDHDPWSLQTAEAHIEVNTMTTPLNIELSGAPHLLYAKCADTVAWPIRPID
ncbi:DUF2071 domain-containing protein [Planctomycetales bacterium ZRK34]|nr:DUF2071 domain-containing protein [Planctomycetales bacterium ZRK34]